MYHTQKQVHISEFILVETGTYQQQYIRPFITEVTQSDIDNLAESTRGGQSVGISAIESVASSLLRSQSTTEGNAGIPNTWIEKRFRFILKVIEEPRIATGTTTQRIFFGYTDNCDASMNHLDPNMRIYFNSETTVQTMDRPTANGGFVKESMILGSNQIISPMDMGAGDHHNAMFMNPTSFLIRPADVFSQGAANSMISNLTQTGVIPGPVTQSYDHYGMASKGNAYKFSNRYDTSPSRYLANVMSGWKHAQQEARMEDRVGDREYILGEAHRNLDTQSMHANDFISILKEECGYMQQGFVTYGDLCSAFPETDRQTAFSRNTGREIRRVSQANDSAGWAGSDNLSIAAASLAQVIPAIMMDNFIRTISFAVTNGRASGQYSVDIHEHGTRSVIDNIEMIPYLEEFNRRLALDVLNTITERNQIGFHIAVSADLAGETIIDIALGLESKTRFVAPTFGDSLFAPVVTREQDHRNKISSDLIYLMEQSLPEQMPVQQHAGYQQTSPAMELNRSYHTPAMTPQPSVANHIPNGDTHEYKDFL